MANYTVMSKKDRRPQVVEDQANDIIEYFSIDDSEGCKYILDCLEIAYLEGMIDGDRAKK